MFSLAQIYTPDNLRVDNGANASVALRDIVLPGGAANGSWPTIARLRGKILFFADPDYNTELESVCAARARLASLAAERAFRAFNMLS